MAAYHIPCETASSSVRDYEFPDSTASDASLGLASTWLQTCITSHLECNQRNQRDSAATSVSSQVIEHAKKPEWHPSRVLDLLTYDAPSIRLIDSRDCKIEGPYVALSHCWGSVMPLRLTRSNISKPQTSISLDELPKTFANVVKVTRRFGIRYLWIGELLLWITKLSSLTFFSILFA